MLLHKEMLLISTYSICLGNYDSFKESQQQVKHLLLLLTYNNYFTIILLHAPNF